MLTYPHIDPVLRFSLARSPSRWYALAYLTGVMLGLVADRQI